MVAEVVDLDVARRRRQARVAIVQAAERVRRDRGLSSKRFTLRRLAVAVAVVRHWRVVDDATLRAAGFAPPAPSPPVRAGRRIGEAA